MSDQHAPKSSRRTVLKKGIAAVAATVGVLGTTTTVSATDTPSPADVRVLKATYTGNSGGARFVVLIPDADLITDDWEPNGGDTVYRHQKSDQAIVSARVSSAGPSSDTVYFDGNPDDVVKFKHPDTVEIKVR